MTWEQLAAATLARQFPDDLARGGGPEDVAQALDRIGPVQSQTARSPYLALAARRSGVTYEAVGTTYEDAAIVRGSTLRGTVHTNTPSDHVLLEVATRLGQRTLWARSLRLDRTTLEQVWEATETYAREEWRTPAELHTHLRSWLDEHDPGHGARLDDTAGRYLGFGHGGLLRRPLRGGWEGQGAPGYRAARAVLGDAAARDAALADPHTALVALVRRHLACHGPASRRDLAWWSGVGLRAVDAALAGIPGLVTSVAPDGQEVHDLPGMPSGAGAHPAEVVPGVRLLPEFDALLCAYDPPARTRFVDPEHYRVLWTQENGLLRSPLLVDGRLTGHWRAEGSGRRRTCVVTWFAGTRRPRKAEVEEQMARVATAYPVTWTGLEVVRA
ncbi:hypothetical protein GCM10011509_21840 [Ornithinimicrobium pekingense]|uniref:Winged helix DNA-binding domain-containing protein n=1 Tax=Ornithinimicrobium pekingense TaxID=384677 RepID=A0ABQ2F8R9_9MICO|nr:hypothetical protein GCM10011509_21840 [Ornithinimicrobium pekingense]